MDNKAWYASRTVWGGVIAALAGILGLFGYQLLPEDQTVLIDGGVAVAALAGGIVSIWGRVKASKSLGK